MRLLANLRAGSSKAENNLIKKGWFGGKEWFKPVGMAGLSKKDFENLYLQSYRVVRNCVFRFVRGYVPLFSFDECEDLIQEVYKEVFESWENFRGECSETTFVVAVAKNFLKNEFRKRLRRSRLAKEQQPTSRTKGFEKPEEASQEDEPSQYMSVEPEKGRLDNEEKDIIRRQQKRIVEELINELGKQDEKLADVIKLYISGFTDKEIGERLTLPGKTVFHWRNKAFEIFKKILKGKGIKSLDDVLE